MKKVVHAACPHDCPDACGVLITIEDGRATRIQGDPKHPVTRGFLCAKVAKYLDRVYSPGRVLYPMKRVARTLRDHRELLLNWFRAKGEISSGAVEGLNNKIRVVTRRSYGFRTYEAMENPLYHTLGRHPGPESGHRFC